MLKPENFAAPERYESTEVYRTTGPPAVTLVKF